MGTKAYCLNNIDHRIDLVRRGARFHYNQHMGYKVLGCFIDAKAGSLLEREREISVPLRNGRFLSPEYERRREGKPLAIRDVCRMKFVSAH